MRNLKLYTSLGALLVGGWLGAGLSPEAPVSGAMLAGYFLWAYYWGIPPVWRWWRKRATTWLVGCSVIGTPLLLGVVVALFFASAHAYSLFGGGIYQCVKYVLSQRR